MNAIGNKGGQWRRPADYLTNSKITRYIKENLALW